MNNTVTLPQLISLLAAEAGCTPSEARKYLHDLFAAVEDALARGESYSIAGVGEFAPGFESERPVLFRPDEALAAALNEPFSAFTAMELPPDLPTEALDDTPIQQPEPEPQQPEPEPEAEPQQPEPETEPEPVPAPEPKAEPEQPEEETDGEEDADNENTGEYPPAVAAHAPRHSTAMWLTIGILIGLIAGLVAGYLAGTAVGRYYIPEDDTDFGTDEDTITVTIAEPVKVQAVETVAAADTTSPAPAAAQQPETTQPAAAAPALAATAKATPEPTYDTVTSTQFLTTLARKHYGVKSYWIFIYEANPSLGNPNNIRPGTRVLIPDRSTFEEATPQATAAKAQERLNALARKYKL